MSYSINIKGQSWGLSPTRVMGVINVTNDSFYEGSRVGDNNLLERVAQMVRDGVDILDIGAYSTRPGAVDVPEEIELEKVTRAISQITQDFPDMAISVDTFRSSVAEATIEAGAHIINDISAGSLDPNMFATVAKLQVPYVLMHMQGTPTTMQQAPSYNDVVFDVISFLQQKIEELEALGVQDIIVDPGFGFGKTIQHNFELLRRLQEFQRLERPILVGVSRKSMIYRTLSVEPQDALHGTLYCQTLALRADAHILRVHDVAAASHLVKMNQAIYPNE